MGSQISATTGRDGSIGHDIEARGSPHHGVDDQIEMTTMAAAAEGGGGATHLQEEEGADMEMAADPLAGSEEEANTPGIEEVQISDIHGSAGGGGASDQVEDTVQRQRDSGIFPNISAAALSVAAAAILRPTSKGLYSEDHLIVAYTLDLIMLLVLGILLFGLTLALALIPNNWVPAVRAAATTVTVTLLLLLLFLVAFVAYGLVRQDHP